VRFRGALIGNRLLARDINREVLNVEANLLATAITTLLGTEAEDTETSTEARTHLLDTELIDLVAFVEEFDTLGATADNDEEIAFSVRWALAPALNSLATNSGTTLAISSLVLPVGGVKHLNPLGVSSEVIDAITSHPLLVETNEIGVLCNVSVSAEPLDERLILAITAITSLLVVSIEVEVGEWIEIATLLEVRIGLNARLIYRPLLARTIVFATMVVALATTVIRRVVAFATRAVATLWCLFCAIGETEMLEATPDNLEATTANNETVGETIFRVISEQTSTGTRLFSRAINVEVGGKTSTNNNRTTLIYLEATRVILASILICGKESETNTRRHAIRRAESYTKLNSCIFFAELESSRSRLCETESCSEISVI
jgi:hypothetical protein